MASSQPLASEAGLQVLKRGGNAADAAVAVAAALNVTEPCSTGIGGDCFCLFYNKSTKKVQGVNGRCVDNLLDAHGPISYHNHVHTHTSSGRCPQNLSLEVISSKGFSVDNPVPARHAHNVTVPGAAAGWVDTIEKFGSGKVCKQNVVHAIYYLNIIILL